MKDTVSKTKVRCPEEQQLKVTSGLQECRKVHVHAHTPTCTEASAHTSPKISFELPPSMGGDSPKLSIELCAQFAGRSMEDCDPAEGPDAFC